METLEALSELILSEMPRLFKIIVKRFNLRKDQCIIAFSFLQGECLFVHAAARYAFGVTC